MKNPCLFSWRFRAAALLGLAGLLGACAPVVQTPSGSHPAVDAAQVKLYDNPPSKYELLGTLAVPVTPEMKWDEHLDCTAGFDMLKTRAAALGANGVLLYAAPGTCDAKVGAGYKGTYYIVPINRQTHTVMAQAIFVVREGWTLFAPDAPTGK